MIKVFNLIFERPWALRLFFSLSICFFTGLSHSQLDRKILHSGWYPWEPYQYQVVKNDIRHLTGLDIGLMRAIFQRMGYQLEIDPISWEQHQRDLRSGKRDIASGAFKSDEREEYVYYSDPYRIERDVIYYRSEDKKNITYHDIKELLKILNEGDYKLGVIDGFYYGPELMSYIDMPANAHKIIKVKNDVDNFHNLISKKIDLFPVDHLVGATLSWRNKLDGQIAQSPVPIFEEPVYVLFSKKTTTPELVNSFNNALRLIKEEGQYSDEVRKYLLPVLLNRTAGQRWFFIIDIIGTIAFSISGLLLARQGGYSLFGALILASLPSVGGGIVRDILVNRETRSILSSPLYLLAIMGTVSFFYLFFRASLWGRAESRDIFIGKISAHFAIEFFDALGLALFAVIGVLVAVETNIQPLWLWAPLLAALTGAGGGIMRDVFRADPNNPGLKGSFYAEVAIIWGFFLGLFLEWYSSRPQLEPAYLTIAVALTVIGGLITRLAVVHYKIRSPMY